jgi:alanine racemase
MSSQRRPTGGESAARSPIELRLAAAGLPPLPRMAWLEIDTDALGGNLAIVRRLVGDAVAVWAVVKADAYGHGADAAARAFAEAGADGLCVATLDEALELRRAGIEAPILVLFRIPTELLGEAAEARLEVVLADEASAGETLAGWSELARDAGSLPELSVHLEVESGLGRAGIAPASVADVAQRVLETPGMRLAGLWTHFAAAEDAYATSEQLAAFESAVDGLRAAGLPIPPRHASASLALFAGSAPHYEGVRPGLCLYGLLPADLSVTPGAASAAARLQPAMALKCRPLRVETVPVGGGVRYGSRWRAERPSRIATLPVGYGDGWPRSSWPGSSVLVRGRRVPLVGTVAMDAVMADVTDVQSVDSDDEFVLLGEQGGERITANELARLRTTIAWEVVTAMAHRLPRVYHAGSVLLAVRTLDGQHRTHGEAHDGRSRVRPARRSR